MAEQQNSVKSPECIFVNVNGVWVCSVCGSTWKMTPGRKAPRRKCGPKKIRKNTMPHKVNLRRIARFLKAITRFVVKGKGKFLSEKEILERFEICKTCEYFMCDACEICGCCVNRQTKFLNKLAFPTEQCPKGKWLRK